jgi:hypothetical protein
MNASGSGPYLAALLLAAAPLRTVAAEPQIPVYTAQYEVEYKGRNLGSSSFNVTHDAANNLYEFTSTTSAKGLLKLARPDPVVERSLFKVVDGRIRPVEFWYEDGSRKGEDNRHVQFDWDRRIATVTDEDGRREVPLDETSLDTGSLHVALMQDLIQNGRPGQYRIADEQMAQAYGYVDNGEAEIETGLGRIATHSYIQQREGSSRSLVIWVAPELNFLPVRLEQRKNGEVTTVLTLVSVEGVQKKN